MPEPSHPQVSDSTETSGSFFKGKEWLANVSFGEAFQRCIFLLQHEFRWLVFMFFIGGFALALILLPINSTIAILDFLIANEIFAPVPDVILLIDLLFNNLMWGLVQKFVLFFGIFLLTTVTVYHVIKVVPSLNVLVPENEKVQFPFGSIIIAAIITASILSFASLIPFLVPLFQALFFFLPILLVLSQFSLTRSLSLSIGLRAKHWIRILSALLIGYLLIMFASVLGLTIYLNIEVILGLYGISLGFWGPILLSLLTQIPIAMVAPLVPLFSVAFFAGARGAYREKQHKKFMQQQQRFQTQQSRYVPLEETSPTKRIKCQHCGYLMEQNLRFCTQCGESIEN